jgi:hypothetical protein
MWLRSAALSYRHPGESRDPGLQELAGCPWTPAFAGVTEDKGGALPMLPPLPPLAGEGRGEGGLQGLSAAAQRSAELTAAG